VHLLLCLAAAAAFGPKRGADGLPLLPWPQPPYGAPRCKLGPLLPAHRWALVRIIDASSFVWQSLPAHTSRPLCRSLLPRALLRGLLVCAFKGDAAGPRLDPMAAFLFDRGMPVLKARKLAGHLATTWGATKPRDLADLTRDDVHLICKTSPPDLGQEAASTFEGAWRSASGSGSDGSGASGSNGGSSSSTTAPSAPACNEAGAAENGGPAGARAHTWASATCIS
jgi:hypothetical protein